MEVNGSGKHSRILQYGNNNSHKMFYSRGPRCQCDNIFSSSKVLLQKAGAFGPGKLFQVSQMFVSKARHFAHSREVLLKEKIQYD